MPGFVKTTRDERGWQAAKDHFQESSGHAPKSDKDYATVTVIYKNWCGKHGGCTPLQSEGSVLRTAGIFQPPPVMFARLNDWVQRTYAGHVWARCEQRLKELDVVPSARMEDVLAVTARELGQLRERILALKPGEVYRVDVGRYGWVATRIYDPKQSALTRDLKWDTPDNGPPMYQYAKGDVGKRVVFRGTFPPDLYTIESVVKRFQSQLTVWQNLAQNQLGILTVKKDNPAAVSRLQDTKRVEMNLLITTCKQLGATKPKAYTAKATWRLPVDFRNWKYTPESQSATNAWSDEIGAPSYVNVELWFAAHTRRSGQYSESENMIQVDVIMGGLGIIDNRIAFEAALGRLTKTVWHELLHFGQCAMRRLQGLSESAGLPSKSIRKPEYDVAGYRNDLSGAAHRYLKRQVHEQRDIEFYTDLSNACFELVRLLNLTPEGKRDRVFKVFVGEVPVAATSKFLVANRFFASWKRDNPGKWRKAVKELYKEMTR